MDKSDLNQMIFLNDNVYKKTLNVLLLNAYNRQRINITIRIYVHTHHMQISYTKFISIR